jgi:hypothetical protein
MRRNMHVYVVTTTANAERIAEEGFQDADCGTRGHGVNVHLTPVIVSADGLVVIVVLVADAPLAPFIEGETACVPARLLNDGYAELITR